MRDDPSTNWQAQLFGCVEDLSWREARGWVVGPPDRLPVKLDVYLDELKVWSGWADTPNQANSMGEARSFRIPLRGIWDYCNVDTRVSIRLGGVPIPIAKKGIYKRPGKDGQYTLDDLKRKLDAGYVFSHSGRLQLSKKLDLEWQAAVIGLYRRVSALLVDQFGLEPFVIYGSLLGQVREQGFIGHDNDFDVAYVSAADNGKDATAEIIRVAHALIDAGFDVETRATALHIHHDADPDVRIDLFHLYFDEGGALRLPFGHAGPALVTRDDWRGTVEAQMGEHTVAVPVGAEKWVEQLYGPGWRTPDPSFHWESARVDMAREGHIPDTERQIAYWANFYAHHEFTTGSSFFEYITARPDLPQVVLDIGCGDGRDAFAFARTGRPTWGIDRSIVGIEHAVKRAIAEGLDDRLDFVNADVADAEAVSSVVTAGRTRANGGPLLFYMRFFLHSIPERVQETLLATIAAHAVEGDVLAAEFRTDKDEGTNKVHGRHYRRYQNAEAFAASLSATHGFEIVYRIESTGLSPYKGEDPVLCRVIARKPAAPSRSTAVTRGRAFAARALDALRERVQPRPR